MAAILLVLLGAFGPARADTLSGRVYAPDTPVGSVLFTGALAAEDGRVFQGTIGRLLPMGVHGGKAHPVDGELVLHSGGG